MPSFTSMSCSARPARVSFVRHSATRFGDIGSLMSMMFSDPVPLFEW